MLTVFDPIVAGHWKKKSEEMLNRIGWGDLDSDEETNASMPELADRNVEREHDSDDDSTQPPPLSDRTLELDSDEETNASMPELAEHNVEREHDSDDDSTQPPPLLDRRLEPESDSESEYETGKSQMSMEELSATVEAIVTPKPSTTVPEWIKAFMVPDADSDEEEEDIEQLMLTKARLDKAPEHLKQIPIADMINFDDESCQNEIYDALRCLLVT